jgi:hypothetical protein
MLPTTYAVTDNPKSPNRCPWCLSHPLMIAYHDTEWGVPLHDDRKLYEFLVLDDLLCLHAGRWHGQRPSRDLFPPPGGQRRLV